MIKSLRKKFVIVAMCSTFAVLAALMGIVNIANYRRVLDRADKMTQLLAENGGEFENPPMDNRDFVNNKEELEEGENARHKPDEISPETPFSTRYFTVTLDEEGKVLSSNLGKIAAISREEAEEYAGYVFKNDTIKGFKGIYRYRVDRGNDDNTMIIFLDCRQDIESFKIFALTSLLVSAFGLLAVFILVLIFSKIVFRPVEESYKKQKQFITDASHEIKTPLTIIDANTEVLEMENGENQWTKSTRNQIERLSVLTQQLITLSRLDESENKIEQSEFLLSKVVFDSVQPFVALAQSKEKQLELELEENICFLGNEKSIRQLVGILLDNAVKYSAPCDNIKVSLKQKGKKIKLQFYNRAENVPQGNLDILFERFYRLDSSRNSETGGSGIGLSVAQAIVLAHKGKITAYSEDGKSLKIVVEFTAANK